MKTSAQRRSRRQERLAAADTGGQTQSGSGSSWRAKSDVRKMGDLRIECKTTGKPSYLLKLSTWKKIWDEAVRGGLETPVMQVQYTGFGATYEMAVMSFALFRQWHAFSQTKDLRFWELLPKSNRMRLFRQTLQDFFTVSKACKTNGVVMLAFQDDSTRHQLAIIEWPLFLQLHEEKP